MGERGGELTENEFGKEVLCTRFSDIVEAALKGQARFRAATVDEVQRQRDWSPVPAKEDGRKKAA